MNWKKLIPKIKITFDRSEEKKKTKEIETLQKLTKSYQSKKRRKISLTEKEKRLIQKLKREGKDVADISKIMEKPYSTIYTRYHTRSDGKPYETPLSQIKKAKKYREQHYIELARRRHQKRTEQGNPPDDHENCPVCNEDRVPKEMTQKEAYKKWVKKNQAVHMNQIMYAIKHKETPIGISDIPTTFKQEKLLQRQIKKQCCYPNCGSDAEHNLQTGTPLCHEHFDLFRFSRNLEPKK